jgi:hypothetical protein
VTQSRVSLLAAAVTALHAVPAGAATHCVKPVPVPGCFPSIQAAVNEAVAGDVVTLAPGVYFENITVPPGKDGLQIVGAGKLKSIIDPDAPLTGVGIWIFSPGVKIRNLGIRNGQIVGIFIDRVDDVVVQGVRVVGVRDGLGAGIAAAVGSDRVQILGNEIRSVSNNGISVVNCADAVVTGNTVAQAGRAIFVSGPRARVTTNKVSGLRTTGIEVESSEAVVAANQIEMVGTFGLLVTGTNPTVQGNKLVNAPRARVTCSPCTGGVMSGNSLRGSFFTGFEVSANAVGFVATGNKATRASQGAFIFSGTAVQASGNSATDTGVFTRSGHCFVAGGGSDHILRANTATRCAESGFFVDADDVILEANTSTQAGLNGFTVFGSGGATADVAVQGNKAFSSNAAGFAVVTNALGTGLDGNTASKNRYGFCDEGTGTIVLGNAFGVPPTSSVCDIDGP